MMVNDLPEDYSLWEVKYVPVIFAFRFSGPVTPLRARAKSKIDYPPTQLPSPVTLVNKLLIITRRNFSK
jgi:hypothetical protein